MPLSAEPAAMHAEALPADPTGLRWVLPGGLARTGRVVRAPDRFGELVSSGIIVHAIAERAALWTWLAGPDWAHWGAPVRDALASSVGDRRGWQFEAAADELLELVSRDVIERGVGDYIASHGGQIRLLRAADALVEVELAGACAHCPAAGLTLHQRIETAIRERLGVPVELRATGGCGQRQARPSWWPARTR